MQNTGDDLIVKVVKLGTSIRKQRAEGKLLSVPPPTIYGYLAFLRMTRARQRLSHIPFVFFTRLTDDLSRLQAYRMGVEDFLSKDTGPDEVLARLQGVLARHESRPTAAAARHAISAAARPASSAPACPASPTSCAPTSPIFSPV